MLEKHVTSLEISKKLKELGVKQESWLYWTKTSGEWRANTGKPSNSKHYYSAFLASELGELLRPYSPALPIYYNNKWKIDRDDEYPMWAKINRVFSDFVFSDTEADARGKMLIYFLQYTGVKI